MTDWLQSYEALPQESKVNVQRWIHFNKFVAHTLRIDEKTWFEGYLGAAMQRPFDYSFMNDLIPGFSGLDVQGQGEAFTRGLEPGAFIGPRVPLRAKNNLGRLSPALQDALGGLLEKGEPSQVSLLASDLAQLQKIFPSAKGLAKLKRPDFKGVQLRRDEVTSEVVMETAGGAEILRLNVLEFAAVMSRSLL